MTQTNPYDVMPYLSVSVKHTSPGLMAAVATLLGLRPAPAERCRVLEIGCASGANLIPLAYAHPHSAFVGIDLSARQIAEGRAAAERAGVRNLELRQADILDAGTALGEFDYIIAHGVYSWVPEPVRDRLLAVCRASLAEQGVGFVSYATSPGARLFRPLRDIALFHARGAADPRERARRAREALRLVASSGAEGNKPYAAVVQTAARALLQQLDELGDEGDSALLHDLLAEVNEPVHFHEFAAHLGRHGLQYLSEAEIARVMVLDWPPRRREILGGLARDVLEREQHIDFISGRMLRNTLVCRAEVTPDRRLRPEALAPLLLASDAAPLPADPQRPPGVETFRAGDGAEFSTNHALSRAALRHLVAVYPRAVPFERLVEAARADLGDPPELRVPEHRSEVAGNLLTAHCYSESLVELRTYQPAYAAAPGERPVGSAVARAEAERRATVTTMRHERVQLDELSRALLRLLDGTRTRAELARELHAVMPEGWAEGGVAGVEQALGHLARAALLVG